MKSGSSRDRKSVHEVVSEHSDFMRKCNFYFHKNRNFHDDLRSGTAKIVRTILVPEHSDFMRKCNFYGSKNRNFS